MRKIRTFLMLMTILATQQVFAADAPEGKACSTIAKSCLAAGFVKGQSADKGIWRDCMKPVILGKKVAGVTVDAAVVKSCREHKIEELKAELNEMQQSS